MENLRPVKSRMKTGSVHLTVFTVLVWLSLSIIWVFPKYEGFSKNVDIEDTRLPQWAQGAEDFYAPLLFVVYPSDYAKSYGVNAVVLKVITFFIGLFIPSILFFMLVVGLESDNLILMSSKLLYDAALFLYVLTGAFLVWWAWLI